MHASTSCCNSIWVDSLVSEEGHPGEGDSSDIDFCIYPEPRKPALLPRTTVVNLFGTMSTMTRPMHQEEEGSTA